MGLSLWLGCYVLTRSPRSRLAWQAALTLWSLAGIFLDVLITLHPSPNTRWWPGWPVVTPLTIWYHLSLETLPPQRSRPQRPWLLFLYPFSILFDLTLGLTPWVVADARQGLGVTVRLFAPGPLFPVLPVALISLSFLTLFNFWQSRQSAPTHPLRKQVDSLVRGTALGALSVAYAMTAAAFQIPAPTLPMIAGLGLSVLSLGYGIVRYSALAEGRILRYDFVFSLLLVAVVAAVYAVVLVIFGVSFIGIVFALAVVIVTHSGYDFARRGLDRLYLRRPERALRVALRNAAVDVGERLAIEEGLRSTLAAVVLALGARWGLIALRESEAFVVQASFHSQPVGERLPGSRLEVSEITAVPPNPPPPINGLALIAPLVAERQSLGAILLGPPRGGATYSGRDLDLVADTADTLAELLHTAKRQEAHAQEISNILDSFQTRERHLQEEIDALRQPADTDSSDAKQIAEVEDALRHLSDYSYLGEHALAAVLLLRHNVAAPTHLDRGKALCAIVVAAIEKLRPAGTEPRDLASREWHPYLILRDAYLRGEANRDIMARLYISEATFHRTRRRALRAVAKAVFEIHPAPALPK